MSLFEHAEPAPDRDTAPEVVRTDFTMFFQTSRLFGQVYAWTAGVKDQPLFLRSGFAWGPARATRRSLMTAIDMTARFSGMTPKQVIDVVRERWAEYKEEEEHGGEEE